MSTKDILNNLRLARLAIDAFPQERVHLDAFAWNDTECGTQYCSAGILSQDPYFQKLGLALKLQGGRLRSGDLTLHVDGVPVSSTPNSEFTSKMDALFGFNAYPTLFSGKGLAGDDYKLVGYRFLTVRSAPDKVVALHRFDCQIARYEMQLKIEED